jgi:hypothetical protein
LPKERGFSEGGTDQAVGERKSLQRCLDVAQINGHPLGRVIML